MFPLWLCCKTLHRVLLIVKITNGNSQMKLINANTWIKKKQNVKVRFCTTWRRFRLHVSTWEISKISDTGWLAGSFQSATGAGAPDRKESHVWVSETYLKPYRKKPVSETMWDGAWFAGWEKRWGQSRDPFRPGYLSWNRQHHLPCSTSSYR